MVVEDIKEHLPGKEIFSVDERWEFIREISEGVDSTREKRRKLTAVMHKYQDDNSCRRIVEALKI